MDATKKPITDAGSFGSLRALSLRGEPPDSIECVGAASGRIETGQYAVFSLANDPGDFNPESVEAVALLRFYHPGEYNATSVPPESKRSFSFVMSALASAGASESIWVGADGIAQGSALASLSVRISGVKDPYFVIDGTKLEQFEVYGESGIHYPKAPRMPTLDLFAIYTATAFGPQILSMRWLGQENVKYQIETAENLNADQWTKFGSVIIGKGTNNVDIPLSPKGSRFYRVIESKKSAL